MKADEDFVDDGFLLRKAQTDTTPLLQAAEAWHIPPQLVSNVQREGVHYLFPVQTAVIPQLLLNNQRACVHPRDMCVSAPTGSGKTIAYALPVIQYCAQLCERRRRVGEILDKVPQDGATNVSRRLVALFMLPSRELAQQVYAVTCRLAQGATNCFVICDESNIDLINACEWYDQGLTSRWRYRLVRPILPLSRSSWWGP
jgi:superfamily II DNA/RNA helicase